MQRAIAAAVCGTRDARSCAVIVPSRGAAEELRRTLENVAFVAGAPPAVLMPDLMPRADFYARLHERLRGAPPLLTGFEREVLLRRSAREAAEAGALPPFRVRSGLLSEILAFYDELRRREQTIDDFDRKLTDALAPSADSDRGAERMLRQTRFLAATFATFERRVADSGGLDEHGLRALLLGSEIDPPYTHVIVTVGDQAADPRGFWPADFDLIARMPGLARLDVVATERLLAAGFHERIHDALPGIVEEHAAAASAPPALMVPEPAPGAELVPWFTSRDREEELADAARWVKASARGRPLARIGIVFQRPLPYLYLARETLGRGAVPYEALDALPLAAEPFAAAVDLVFAFTIAEGTRTTLVELLESPHWVFPDPSDGRPAGRAAAAAVDQLLRELKYLGGWDRLDALAGESSARAASDDRRTSLWRRAAPALRAAAGAAAAVRAAVDAPTASAQIHAIRRFIVEHERLPRSEDAWHSRHLRARAAILSALNALAEAHLRHDEEPVPFPELVATIRRWLEAQTFSPRTGSSGVLLLDAAAAGFADLDDVRVVGLAESDWPERATRSIFYPAALLGQLGWPADVDRLAAARARFLDLLWLPARTISASVFTLEDDALAAASPFLEELGSTGLTVRTVPRGPGSRIFVHEALAGDPMAPSGVQGEAAAWLSLRTQRSAADEERYHGWAGARDAGVYAVSHVERYLECPFKYFAAYVLRLEEERDDESGLTPQERGQLLHAVFEAFFDRWRGAGRGAITADNVADALVLFEQVAEDTLGRLPEADRALERTYLLGSAAGAGLAERAFAFEIEQGVEVLERLLEHALEGEFVFQSAGGPRPVRIRSKADRIDLLADGTLRVIDYKLGRAPKHSRALQLPIYGVTAQQQLAGRLGRTWTLSRAGYVAFREKNAFVPLGGATGTLEKALAEGQERLLAAIDGVERGEFPPRPDEPWICTRCGFSMVCRKDYVGDE